MFAAVYRAITHMKRQGNFEPCMVILTPKSSTTRPLAFPGPWNAIVSVVQSIPYQTFTIDAETCEVSDMALGLYSVDIVERGSTVGFNMTAAQANALGTQLTSRGVTKPNALNPFNIPRGMGPAGNYGFTGCIAVKVVDAAGITSPITTSPTPVTTSGSPIITSNVTTTISSSDTITKGPPTITTSANPINTSTVVAQNDVATWVKEHKSVVGGIAAGIIVLVLLLIGSLLWVRVQRRRRQERLAEQIEMEMRQRARLYGPEYNGSFLREEQ